MEVGAPLSRGAKFVERMKNPDNNGAVNSAKLVHKCYLKRIFRPILINFVPLTAKRHF